VKGRPKCSAEIRVYVVEVGLRYGIIRYRWERPLETGWSEDGEREAGPAFTKNFLYFLPLPLLAPAPLSSRP
jgi:hypothetical protein